MSGLCRHSESYEHTDASRHAEKVIKSEYIFDNTTRNMSLRKKSNRQNQNLNLQGGVVNWCRLGYELCFKHNH